MSRFAQNGRSGLYYGVQTDFTTEATSFTRLPYSTQSLDLTKTRVQGTDVTEDRMQRVDRHGTRQVSGDIVADLRAGDYDDLLAAGLLNAWSSDVLQTGTTPLYMTIQDYAADIDQARTYTGCTVGSIGISIAPDQMATTTFGIVGRDLRQDQVEKTFTESSGNAPFDSYSGLIQIGDTGGALTNNNRVTSLELTIANSFSPTLVVGSNVAPCLSYGMSNIEISASVLYEDDDEMNRFLNEVETALSFSLDDPTGSNTYTFDLPRVKINTATTSVTGQEGSRMVEISAVALYDSTSGYDVAITRPDSS